MDNPFHDSFANRRLSFLSRYIISDDLPAVLLPAFCGFSPFSQNSSIDSCIFTEKLCKKTTPCTAFVCTRRRFGHIDWVDIQSAHLRWRCGSLVHRIGCTQLVVLNRVVDKAHLNKHRRTQGIAGDIKVAANHAHGRPARCRRLSFPGWNPPAAWSCFHNNRSRSHWV